MQQKTLEKVGENKIRPKNKNKIKMEQSVGSTEAEEGCMIYEILWRAAYGESCGECLSL